MAAGAIPGKGADNMSEYLIAFNDEWVPDHTVEELRAKSRATRALVAEMKALPSKIDDTLAACEAPVRAIAETHATREFFLYQDKRIGRKAAEALSTARLPKR